MQHKFLVDVNLPKYFKFFNKPEFEHVVDLNPQMQDDEIWNYALSNNLIILTKDVDFHFKYLSQKDTPKIIYFQLGNITLKELHKYFQDNWEYLIQLIENNSFIIATKNDIKVIN